MGHLFYQKMEAGDQSWMARKDFGALVVDNSQLLKPFNFIDDNVRDFYNIGTEYNNTDCPFRWRRSTSFYFSYGNVTSNGVIPSNSDNLQRNTFSLRTNSKFNKFTINSSFNYVNKKSTRHYRPGWKRWHFHLSKTYYKYPLI